MMDQKKPPAFTKMLVTGPRSAELVVTNAMQGSNNPTLNAIAETDREMADALARAAPAGKKPKPKRARRLAGNKRITASTANTIYDLGLQRLHALKAHFDQTYNPLVQLLTRQGQLATLAPMQPMLAQVDGALAQVDIPATVAQPSASKVVDESSAASLTARSRVLEVLSDQFRPKFKLLSNYLVDHPDLIRVGAGGRPVINGVEVPGASFVDAMRSLYMWRKYDDLPAGTHEILRALQSVGVPKTLLSSTAAKNVYEDIPRAETEGETYESPDEDPVTAEPPKATAPQATTSQYGKGHVAPPKWPGKAPEVLFLYKP